MTLRTSCYLFSCQRTDRRPSFLCFFGVLELQRFSGLRVVPQARTDRLLLPFLSSFLTVFLIFFLSGCFPLSPALCSDSFSRHHAVLSIRKAFCSNDRCPGHHSLIPIPLDSLLLTDEDRPSSPRRPFSEVPDPVLFLCLCLL